MIQFDLGALGQLADDFVQRCGRSGAGAVAAVLAATSSTMAISMSVAVNDELAVAHGDHDVGEDGDRVALSTTLCTWASAFISVARSAVNFIV